MLINYIFFCNASYNSSLKSRYTSRILGRRFTLKAAVNIWMLEWVWDLFLLWRYFLVIIKGFREIILPYAIA